MDGKKVEKLSPILHDEFVTMWNNGDAIKDIAKKFDVSENYVSQYSHKHRDECPKRHTRLRNKKINHLEFVKLWNQGILGKVIASKFGVTAAYVSKYAKDHRDECPKERYSDK